MMGGAKDSDLRILDSSCLGLGQNTTLTHAFKCQSSKKKVSCGFGVLFPFLLFLFDSD